LEALETAIKRRAGTALVMRLGEVGLVSEAMRMVATARAAGWRSTIVYQAGEAGSAFEADLAVGLGVGQLRVTGAPCRHWERLCGYNQWLCKYQHLLRIEMELGWEEQAVYAGY
jgi:enolase